jgi:hypothetical protein
VLQQLPHWCLQLWMPVLQAQRQLALVLLPPLL